MTAAAGASQGPCRFFLGAHSPPSVVTGMDRSLKAFAIVSLASLTFLIYSNVLGGPFVFDDGMYIVKNWQIKDPSSLWPPSTRYLTYLSFAMNYAVGGLDPFGYHLFNVAVHAANAALVFAVTGLLFNSPLMGEKGRAYAFPAALIASFLFASHPVQTQAVSYVTQRFASLTAFFYLLSLASYLKWRASEGGGRRAALYAVSLLSAIAAQFTKETGFTLPAVIVLTELLFFRGHGGPWRRLARLVPFILVMAIVPLALFGSAGSGVAETTRLSQLGDLEGLSRHDYMATQLRVMATYLRLLVLPMGQNLDYDYPLLGSFLLPEVVLSALLVAVVMGTGVFLAARGAKEGHAPRLCAGYGLIFFFMAISVESSVIPIRDVIYEHRLYLPNAGAAMFFSAALMGAYDFLRGRQAVNARPLVWALAATVLLSVPLAAATWSRNGLWADEVLLWRDVAAKSPAKARVRNNLGYVLYWKGMTREALEEFRKAVDLDPSFADARYNLGNSYKDLGRMDEAAREFEEAVRIEPGKLNARNNLGLAYYTLGRYAEAAEQFVYIISVSPGHFRARNHLGLAYLKLGRQREAAGEFRAALSINPAFEDAAANLRMMETDQGAR